MPKGKSIHIDGEIDKIEKVERDELAELVCKGLNKSQTDGSKIAFFLDEQEDPSMISEWVSTGSSLLDLAISNRKNGGLPVGRIVSFEGLESSGKSLLCAHIAANTQKMGGYCAYIDIENAAAPQFWRAVGVSLKDLGYMQLITVEEIFSKIEEIVALVRKTNNERLITIILDSLTQASCETEMESQHGKDGYNTSKAIIVSKALRKIVGLIGRQRILLIITNQLRQNLQAIKFGDKWIVPSGKAMAFAASVRVRLGNTGALKKNNKIIGNNCKAVVTKNRIGPPKRQAMFEIHFDSGIQDLKSWLDFLKEIGKARKDDDKTKIKLPSGNVSVTVPEFVEKINTDLVFKDEVYNTIAEEYIMKYRDPNSQIIEDIEVDESVADEE
jgi:recombination protein RecA